MYRNSYFRLLQQRYCFSSSHNSLIKSIISKIFLSQRIDFEKSMKRLKNFQNYNRLYKRRNSRPSSYFIFSRLKLHRLLRTLLYSFFSQHCSMNFDFNQSIRATNARFNSRINVLNFRI